MKLHWVCVCATPSEN